MVGITACFSIAFFAIPASMLTWGFEAEAERLFNKAVERRRRRIRAKAEGRCVSDSEESEDEGDEQVWREYEAVVVAEAGGEEGAAARAEEQAAAVAAELFRRCDADGSGELSMEEVSAHLTSVLLSHARSGELELGDGGDDGAAGGGDVGARLGRLEAAVGAQAVALGRVEELLRAERR